MALEGLGAEAVGFTERVQGDAGKQGAVNVFHLIMFADYARHGKSPGFSGLWSVIGFWFLVKG